MRTKLDPDDEFFIPDVSGLDWSNAEIGRYARAPGEKTEICIDGAVGYELRLIPSGKVLARFVSTLEAWPAIIATAESGRSPRTLSLDAIGPNNERWHMAAGSFLIGFARVNNGEPHPYPSRAPRAKGGKISAGPSLERWARHNNGEPWAYTLPKPRPAGRRVADA